MRAPRLREVTYRLVPRPGARSQRLPLRISELSQRLVVETRVAHLDDRGHVWRILDVFGPAADLARVRSFFRTYRPVFLVEKSILAEGRDRLILWYKYRPPPRSGSHTALAFRWLGRDAVLTDRTTRGTLTIHLLTRAGRGLRRFLEEARRTTEAGFTFELVYAGPPRGTEQTRLSPEEEEALRVAAEAGYFDVPRRAGLRQLAKGLRVSASAAGYRLRSAQRKLVAAHLDMA